ncbi:MAG: histidine kinase, partial [Actinomycetota bacterium]|nr:histidine kinase [Actinomycetota bacterium]
SIVAAAWLVAAGTLVASRRTRRRAPIPAVIGAIAAALVIAQIVNSHVVAQVSAALLLPAGAIFILGLPDGDFTRWGLRTAGAVLCASLLPIALASGAVAGYGLSLGVLSALGAVVVLPLAYARYRSSSGGSRQRWQWVGLGLASVCEMVVLAGGLRVLVGWPPQPFGVIVAATGLIPMAFVIAHQPFTLARVDRMLAALVSVIALTAAVGGLYLLAIIGLGGPPGGEGRAVLGWSLAAAAVAALAYGPIRLRLAEVGNRLVYGEIVAPDTALRTFGTRLTRAVPMDELLLQLAESLRRTMGTRRAEIWTGAAGLYQLTASAPRRSSAPLTLGENELQVVARAGVTGGRWVTVWLGELAAGRDPTCLRVVPLTHRGDLLGIILVERPDDASTFTDGDDEVLRELARQVSMALHNVQLDSALRQSFEDLRQKNAELQESRARIVAAGDAERRKLERDLHDGAQQHLFAISVKIGLAREAVDSDPADVTALLGELTSDIQEALQQLRSLAHGIYPPLLLAGGLSDALPIAARRASLPTTIGRCEVARYPPELEAAVYYCCLEALQNAAKHAGPDAVATIGVWQEQNRLWFEVADNGAGFDQATGAQHGHGFVNMGDRLGAMNGGLQVESAPGAGTRVSGQIPIATTE